MCEIKKKYTSKYKPSIYITLSFVKVIHIEIRFTKVSINKTAIFDYIVEICNI